MDVGPNEAKILHQAFQGDGRIPERIKNAPDLNMGLGIFMVAFNDLLTSRNDTGFIPWGCMRDWAEAHKPGDDEFVDDVMYFVHELDIAYVKHKKKNSKAVGADQPDNQGKGKRPPKRTLGAG